MGGEPIAEAWYEQARMFYSRMLQPEPATTLELARRSSAAFRAAGDSRNVAFVDGYAGIALGDLGQDASGEATLRGSLSLAARLGETLVATNSRLYLALLLARRRDGDEEAYASAGELVSGNALAGGVAHGIRAEVLLARGDLAGADEESRTACEMLAMMPPLRLHPMAIRIGVLVASGEVAAARALAEEGLAVLEAIGGAGYNEVVFRVAAAEARRAAGDEVGAREALDGALARIDRGAADVDDREARATFLASAPGSARARALMAAWSGAPTA